MRRSRWFLLVTFVFLAASLRADCVRGQDHRSSKNSGVLITDFTINGTQALGSDELAAIESEMLVPALTRARTR